jgi:hypothetical protein
VRALIWIALTSCAARAAGPTPREALARALAPHHARVMIGRTWIGPRGSVIEFELDRIPHPAIGAAVIERDGAVRVYLDEPTLHGELRGPPAAPLDQAIVTARDSAIERANLAVTDRIWERLDAHDPDGVLAACAPGYLYDDLSGPAPLDTHGTRDLLVRFLALVPDFAIAAKPTYFAAGDDVITESVEHMTLGGRAITLHGLDVKHFVDGRVAKEWQYANGAEIRAYLSAPSASAMPSPSAQ